MSLAGLAGALATGAGVLQSVGQIAGIALPIVQTLFGNKNTTTNQTGGSNMTGASSSAQQSTSAGQTVINLHGLQQGQTSQQGNTSALGQILNQAMGTATGNNSLGAFLGNMFQAATANRLQNSQWEFANAMNQYQAARANEINLQAVASARQYNSLEAEKSRNWSRMMRQTGYQDTVKDLQAAGLNPILAASRGATEAPIGPSASASTGGIGAQAASAASIPSAKTATMQAMYDYGNNTTQFLNNAMATINNAKQFGFEEVAKNVTQDMLQVSETSSKQISQTAQNVSSWLDSAQSQFWNFTNPFASGEKSFSGMRGGKSHGGGGGRGR